jgi:hypothetical protein
MFFALEGFGNRFGIDEVVLVRLHERLHELRCDQPGVVSLFASSAVKKVSARTNRESPVING